MSRFLPTAAELAALRFRFGAWPLPLRLLVAGALFTLGFALACFAGSLWLQRLGFAVIVAGHLPLWVRGQTNAPGGATPKHEDVWAPVEDGWLERVLAHERRGERWDTTPWDVTNRLGKLVLFALLGALAVGPLFAGAAFDSGFLLRWARTVPWLLVPLWFNGMRTTWNPSELRLKGEALAAARAAAQKGAEGIYDFVPMLALRRSARGGYPVDARLMLRPAREDAAGYLGIQFQAAINSVQGKDFPYLYAVVLGKEPFRLSGTAGRRKRDGVELVDEFDTKEGVRFHVIRQHADKSGGWHTEPSQIAVIAAEALRFGEEARRDNGGGGGA